MVGAQLDGFDCMVRLSKEAPIAILEGDEYLSSPIDLRPKFHLYFPNIALLSGIAWDHINVFPTFDIYVEQFKIFLDCIQPAGSLVYCENDAEVKKLSESHNGDYNKVPYREHEYVIENGVTSLITSNGKVELQIFGRHNLQNLNGAFHVCKALGVSEEGFYRAIATFKGAARRLELVKKNEKCAVYKDFAHSPSKLKATTNALKEQYTNRTLIACMELHTFSSLNAQFLEEYNGAMASADEAYVYFNPHTIEHKKLAPITVDQVKKAFGSDNIHVYTNSSELLDLLLKKNWEHSNLLMMSSGNFDGIDYADLGAKVCG